MPQFTLWIWLGIVVVATVVELFTMDLNSVWFAAAGLVAMVLSAFKNVNWVIQLVVFVVLSSVLIVFLRPICRKLMFRKTAGTATNKDMFIGKKVIMLSEASFGKLGSAKIADVVWSVMPQNEADTIAEGEIVEVTNIEGNKLIVKKCTE